MKFINAQGELEEGTALTEPQVQQRQHIIDFVHEKVCGGGPHYGFQRTGGSVKCEMIANFFVTNFTLKPLEGLDFEAEIEKAAAENRPKELPLPDPAPAIPYPVNEHGEAALEDVIF